MPQSSKHDNTCPGIPLFLIFTLYTILYHFFFFGGDILNTGLAFMLILVIITQIILSKLLKAARLCALPLAFISKIMPFALLVIIVTTTIILWDIIDATCEILKHPPEPFPRHICHSKKILGFQKLNHYNKRWRFFFVS